MRARIIVSLTDKVNDASTSKSRYAYANLTDIQFSLKLWWALWCISKEKKTKSKFNNGEITSNLKEIFKPCTDNPRIIMDENVSRSTSAFPNVVPIAQ